MRNLPAFIVVLLIVVGIIMIVFGNVIGGIITIGVDGLIHVEAFRLQPASYSIHSKLAVLACRLLGV